MVRTVRILWARNVARACRRISERVIKSDLGPQTAEPDSSRCNLGFRPAGGWPKSEVLLSDVSLLQNDFLSFFQPAEHFGLGAVGDSDVHCDLLLAILSL